MSSSTLDYLAHKLWKSKLLADVYLEFDGKTFLLHRILLYRSFYLQQLCENSDSKSSISFSPNNPNVKSKGLEICLASLYGIDPVLTVDEVWTVLITAHILELDTLCESCVSFMRKNISVDVYLEWHSMNCSWNGGNWQNDIKDLLDIFLCRSASREARDILNALPNDNLERVLTSNALWIPSEADRFKLIVEIFEAKRSSVCEESPIKASDSPIDPSASTRQITSSSNHTPEQNSQCGSSDLNNYKDSTFTIFQSLLEPANIYYQNFSFSDLVHARKKAHELGFFSIVESIMRSLWTKSTLEHMIHCEVWTSQKLNVCGSAEQLPIPRDRVPLNECTEFGENSSTLRFSTEISDIESFSGTGQFTSEQVYYAGSLFRVVLSIGFDETSDKSYIGIYLQRTIIYSSASCAFCDPRSDINVSLEFIAGTYILEVIDLDGMLQTPCSNRGYSKFIPLPELTKYLSPVRTLRVTVILKMLFNIPNSDEN